jgi:hypothetical protein
MTRTATLIRPKLPIGLQTFAKLRSEDCYYVDKTGMAIEVADEHLKFVFLTGVSKFSKVSLFSGLNHLKDLTLDARYSALCGYTDEDVNTVFAPELPGLDREEIRRWYNGYNWLGTGVYNPYDLLLLFDRREFKAYWFETGTPTFLVKLLAEQQFFTLDLGRLYSDDTLLSVFDVEHIGAEALRQVKALGYAEKYRDRGEPVLLVGVEFGRAERNVVGFNTEPA